MYNAVQIKDAIRLKRPTLVFKKNGSSINMLLPGNKKNHLITYNWQNIISMNSNIFSIIHISLIRKINIFLYLKKVLLPSKLQKCISRETLNIVNCGVSYHDSLCIIIFFNFKKTGIKLVYIIMIHLH